MDKYYTVEQIANLLNMHPKTIQRYIREGKLIASKVGKSWRVTGHDLSVFTEKTKQVIEKITDIEGREKPKQEKVKISSVIDIETVDMDEGIRIMNTLTAALNSKPAEYGKSTMSTQFLEPEKKVRVMLWGNIKFMEDMLFFISSLTEQD
jgi:excisionase family DNA binding protein